MMTAFTASVLAQPEAISELTERLLRFLETQQVDHRASHHVALIVEELLTNIGTHGNCRDIPARISLAVAPAEVTGEVVDSGSPFDPRDAPEPDLESDVADRPVGGLGLFLVRRFTSALEYVRRNGENYTTFAVPRGADQQE
jgi:anti-sigma regulatory factor (Ser/Thr protein kinase)